ncbi:TonB-dependent receptor plug domain-containing protein [Fibrella sp. HMF5335]|uniref:TonB-dependent receptor plug domain-containing protein n=1 Tax=Fibrella rubiginis TaxID=2817060 RepID=A0A939GFV5_9BACT|nr:TonB-dependent receptor plug domain-containing protein [Fibrella rubiginis]MBO0935961.1 TonB-dependent receptor plug domain-containing protein [Fibrella rubiginis]
MILFAHLVLGQVRQSIWLDTVQVVDRVQPTLTVGLGTWQTDSSLLQLTNLRSLADALPTVLPVSVRNYGNGMLSTLSVRGTGPSHSTVNWNGLPLSSPMLGQQDLALIPGIAFNRLSLQTGSYNTVVGADAVSGVLALQTTPSWTPGLRGAVMADVGSFGRYAGQVTLRYGSRSGRWSGQTGSYGLTLANNFPYQNLSRFGKPIEEQTNAGIRQWAITQSIFGQLTSHSLLALHGWWQSADRYLQPGIGESTTGERQQDESLRLTAQLSGGQSKREWLVQLGFIQDYLRYVSPLAHLDEPSTTRQFVVRAEQTWSLHAQEVTNPGWTIRVGAESIMAMGQIAAYQGQQSQTRADGYALLTGILTPRLTVTGQFRQGWASGFSPPPVPALGATYRLVDRPGFSLTGRLHLSRTYRMPTLNDRFWRPGGNESLRPESGWSQEGGFTLERTPRPNQSLRLLLTAYHTLIHDWILWLPQANAGYWSPRNVQVVRSRGLESQVTYTVKKGAFTWQNGLNLAYTRVNEVAGPAVQDASTLGLQLPYAPVWVINSQHSVTHKAWTIGGQVSYTGAQATQADHGHSLRAFWLVNAQLHHRFTQLPGFTGSLQVNNLTQSIYQTIENKAMPGLNGRLQLAYAFH